MLICWKNSHIFFWGECKTPQNSASTLVIPKRLIHQELHWFPINFKLYSNYGHWTVLQDTCKNSYNPANPSAAYVLNLKICFLKCNLEFTCNCLMTEHLLRLPQNWLTPFYNPWRTLYHSTNSNHHQTHLFRNRSVEWEWYFNFQIIFAYLIIHTLMNFMVLCLI